MRLTLLALAAVALIVAAGCDEDDEMMAVTTATLTIDIDGIEDLGAGYVYEGWIIVGGEPVSTGTFGTIGGVPDQTSFQLERSQLESAAAFVLTIEPSPDGDPAPSATKYLAGDDSDFAAGIWWLDPGAGPGATLELPVLPSGWVYEGWVADGSGPVTTGRFTMAAGVDSDGAGGALAGNDPAPPFPGQDFIHPLRLLTDDHAAVISIEPEPDDSSAPFALKPLVDPSIDDVGIGVLQPMSNQAAMTLPTGMVTR